jgi:glycosyltransferase involved in cell wall biosynthesis
MYVQVNHATEDEQHILLDLLVPYLRVGSYTREVRFKIVSTSKWFGVEFRNSPDSQPLFSAWPGTESDKFGAKFTIGSGGDISRVLAKVQPQDIQFLAWLFRALQEILQEALKGAEISSAGRKQLIQGVQAFLCGQELHDLISTNTETDLVSQSHAESLEAIVSSQTEALRKLSQRSMGARRNFSPANLSEFFTFLYSDKLLSVSSSGDPVPSTTNPIVISVVRNEMAIIGEYFEHYRNAGIRRFVIVDNGSTDGTLDFVSAQPDADVYSQVDLFSTIRKQAWINQIILRYGYARWYLIADADEHVVFDGIERHGFSDIVMRLETQHCRAGRGMLIDMYNDRPLNQLSPPHASLRREHRFFDPGPYIEVLRPEMISCRGGVRRRMFSGLSPDFDPELTKYPLLKLEPGEFVASPHHIWPPSPHLADPRIFGILHYKFTNSLSDKVIDAVARGQYWNHSAEYVVYEAAFARDAGLVLKVGESTEYVDSGTMCSLGLIQKVAW